MRQDSISGLPCMLKALALLPPSAGTVSAEQHYFSDKHGMRMQAGVFNETGQYEKSVLRAGDAGFAPVSSGHYFKNIGETESYVVLIFNAGRFTNLDLTALVGNVPAEVRQCRIHPAQNPYLPKNMQFGSSCLITPQTMHWHMEECLVKTPIAPD